MALHETAELPKKRMQFEASQLEYKRLLWLMHVCGLDTNKDLFNNALTIFEWAVNEVGAGRKVGSMDDKEFTALSMPSLRTASHTVPKYRDAVPTNTELV